MIDIHCHLLYKVDDGARTMEESVAMLQEAAIQGIEAIILTPHFRHGMFPYDKTEIEAHFEQLKPYAKENNIGLFLGTEYHVNSQMMENFSGGRCHTLADGKFILTEYSFHSEFSYVKQMTQEAIRFGYIPIIAHVERYAFVMDDPLCLEELKEMGALIQINADAVLGLEGRGAKKLCKVLLKDGLVDIVASDSHGINERACHMKQCYAYVARKYGKVTAEELFCENPAQILATR